MNALLWTVASALAVVMMGAGLLKLVRSPGALVNMGMAVAADFPTPAVRALGVVEVLGGVGLVLPAVLSIAPSLVAAAAAGVALVMVGAVAFHLRRKELLGALPAVLLLAAALFVVWGRTGSWSF